MTHYNLEKDPKGRFGRSNSLVQTLALGTVYEAIEFKTNQLVYWYKLKVEPDMYKSLEKVVDQFLQVQHDSLLPIYALWESNYPTETGTKNIEFVTRATSKISLREFLNAQTPLELQDVLLWSFQLVSALHCLHSQKESIVHGNVRPENIFFSIDMQRVILGDLLSSWFLRQASGPLAKQTSTSVSAREYFVVAEEIGEEWDVKDDIFAFGLCLFEMTCCVEKDIETDTGHGKERFHHVKDTSAKESIKVQLKRLIKSCLGPKEKRPTASDILNDSLYQRQGNNAASCCANRKVDERIWERTRESGFSPVASFQLETENVVAVGTCGTSDLPSTRLYQRNSPSGFPRHLVVQNQTKEPTRVVGDAQVEVVNSPESKYNNCVRLSIQIPIEGSFKRIEFNFDPLQDSPESLAEEMVIELNLHALQLDVIKHDIEKHLQRILGTFPINHMEDEYAVQKNKTDEESSSHEESNYPSVAVYAGEQLSRRQETNEKCTKEVIVSTEYPLEEAVSRRMPTDTIQVASETLESTCSDDLDLFWDSIYSGNKQQVDYYLLKNPALVCCKDENQRTPLHIAAAEGYMELVKLLVAYGAPLDVADRWGLTPILEAVASNHQQIVDFLRNQVKSSIQPKSFHSKVPAFSIIPSYYPIFDSQCNLTAQELVSIMCGQDTILDTSDESTSSSLHTCVFHSHSSSTELAQQPSSGSCWRENSNLQVDSPFEIPGVELRKIEEEYKQKKEQLRRRFTQAKSGVVSKWKQEPSPTANSFIVSL